MVTIKTKEKEKCLEQIKELEEVISSLEEQGYNCEYYKAGIEVMKNTESNISTHDFIKTSYGPVLKYEVAMDLQDKYVAYLKDLEKYKSELVMSEEQNKRLEELLSRADKEIQYDMDSKLLVDYTNQLTPYLRTVIKNTQIPSLAKIIYRVIKVEYSQNFTTEMLSRLNSSMFPIMKTKIFSVMTETECYQTIINEVERCLNEDLKKYNISASRHVDSIVIEQIVTQDNRNFISLDDRLADYKIDTRNFPIVEQKPSEKATTFYRALRDKLLFLKGKWSKKVQPEPPTFEEEVGIIINSPNLKDPNSINIGIYEAQLKRPYEFGVTTVFHKRSRSNIRRELLPPDALYVLYDELHPEAAYEIITGRKIDVLSSTEGNLPAMFIERKNEDTEKFDILWPNELEDYLKIDKDTLNKQLDYWEYEGKKGIYNRTQSHSYQKKKM